MTEVTNQILYDDLLKLDQKLEENLEGLQDIVSFMKEMNRELADERSKTELLKRKFFGNRLEALEVIVG
ncbi:hypothetical protein [Rhizobium sp. 18055]|uniref:hypothetical protein n=1 Tax=Rhizobium sp. 18055 TaxID=2681403 RepID=UPI001359CBFB|nr:hypothetical protein [Rhizobium sp. 18055]